MSALANVLLYGQDVQLTQTRALVLQRTGYAVHIALGIDQLEAEGERAYPDLVIFCHTLSRTECQVARDLVSTRWPLARRLNLTSGSLGCFEGTPTEVMDTHDGPQKLVSRVAHLVGA